MIADHQLLASALGELTDEAEDAVSEHVLGCGPCAARYASLVELGPAIAELVRDAQLAMPITKRLLARLDAAGLVSRRYVLAPGATVPCSVGANDIYSLVRFEADFAGVTRADLLRDGARIPDVPFDPIEGTAYILTPSSAIRKLPTAKLAFRLLSIEAGGERMLADYTLDHTAFKEP